MSTPSTQVPAWLTANVRPAGSFGRAADAIDEAGWELERRGGCLLCINADDDARARLGGCRHAVVVGPGEPMPVS